MYESVLCVCARMTRSESPLSLWVHSQGNEDGFMCECGWSESEDSVHVSVRTCVLNSIHILVCLCVFICPVELPRPEHSPPMTQDCDCIQP